LTVAPEASIPRLNPRNTKHKTALIAVTVALLFSIILSHFGDVFSLSRGSELLFGAYTVCTFDAKMELRVVGANQRLNAHSDKIPNQGGSVSGSQNKKTLTGNSSDFKRILLAVDGSENSERASRVATRLAQKDNAYLVILNVVPGIKYYFGMGSRVPIPQTTYEQLLEAANETAREIIDKQVFLARNQGIRARGKVLQATGTIVQEIVDFAAQERADLIVLGTRGLGGFKRMLMGSVSSGVVNHAYCSVLVVK
jgi:nucleotide-binding universal stress UspA family protein